MRKMLFLAVAWVVTLALSSPNAVKAKEGGICRLLGQWHTTEERVVQGKYISGDITFIPLPEEKRGQFRLRQYASDTPSARGGVPEHRTALMYGYYVVSDHRGSNSHVVDFERVEIYPIFRQK